MNRLLKVYKEKISPEIKQEMGYNNLLQVPKISKVVVNIGVGSAVKEKSDLTQAIEEMRLITGQQPRVNASRKSISNFLLRKGTPIGVSVILRGERMYEFVDKLFNIVLPRQRDFHGLSLKGLDGHGNYSLGLEEQTIFPEINPNQVKKSRGLQITIVTTAKDNQTGELLLRKLGCPLEKNE